MEHKQPGLNYPSEDEISALSDQVDTINQEIMRLEFERSGLYDPRDSDRIDQINQTIPRLVDERTQLFRRGAQ